MNDELKKPIITPAETLLSENGGEKEAHTGIWRTAEKSFLILFDEKTQTAKLLRGDTQDSQEDMSVISVWLFNDDSTLTDAKSIGADFADALTREMSLKKGNSPTGPVLPRKGEKGSRMDEENLAQKFLSLFPVYKDAYIKNCEKYGQFLPDDFFYETARPKMIEILKQDDKKAAKKFFEWLSDFYLEGNTEVRSIITATIIGELAEYPELAAMAYAHMDLLLRRSAAGMVQVSVRRLKKNKTKTA